MALEVEDGTGKTNAEAYDTVANVETYLTAYGGPSATWTAGSETDKENWCRIATRFLDAEFGRHATSDRYQGRRTNETQALDWPRSGVYDADQYLIDYNVIPAQLKAAMAVMADKASAADLMPDQAAPGSLSSKLLKVGPITIDKEFVGSQSLETFHRLAEALLGDLLEPAGRLRRA